MRRPPDAPVCLPSQTVGPFFHLGLTANAAPGCLAGPQARGERLKLRVTLLDGDALPVPDGMIEVWQADAAGRYAHPADTRAAPPDPGFRGFGRLATGAQGQCTFETVRPGRVPHEPGGWQAAHINVSVFARGLLGRLCTRVYFAGDPDLADDPVLALAPVHRRPSLLAQWDAAAGVWDFPIRLQGDGETVFFDV